MIEFHSMTKLLRKCVYRMSVEMLVVFTLFDITVFFNISEYVNQTIAFVCMACYPDRVFTL